MNWSCDQTGKHDPAQNCIIQVRATQQDVVEGDAVMLAAGVEQCLYLAWLVWMVNSIDW